MVPWKRKGVCGIKATLERSDANAILEMSIPFICIVPSIGESLNKAWRSELLPAPVRPTTPTLLPGFTLKLT